MEKNLLGEIIFSIKRRNKFLCIVHIHRDGLVVRSGNGIKNSVEFKVVRAEPSPKIFNELIKHIPQHIVSTKLFGLETEINEQTTEYNLSFHAVATNKTKGSKKLNTDDTGIRIFHNQGSTYKHPLLPAVMKIGEKMLELTDTIYFDAVILSVFGLKAHRNGETIQYKGPEKYADKAPALEKYIAEIVLIHKWTKLVEYAKHQIYKNQEGDSYKIEGSFTHKLQILPLNNGQVTAQNSHSIYKYEMQTTTQKRISVNIADNDYLPINLVLKTFISVVLALVTIYGIFFILH